MSSERFSVTGPVSIFQICTIEHFKECERIQQEIWGGDPIEVVPSHLLVTAQRHGGLVLGAFDTSGHMVGFLFGFPGRVFGGSPERHENAQWQHCSHVLGVVPAWRRQGVGFQLKVTQRAWMMEQGIAHAAWTYDPLEAVNAELNIGRLGAVCGTYVRDIYGNMADTLNSGLPSDRFEVDWLVADERVNERILHGWKPSDLNQLLNTGAVVVNPGSIAGEGIIEPTPVLSVREKTMLIEIPTSIQTIKKASLGRAIAWRLNVREAAESLFEAGYEVRDVTQTEDASCARMYYVLQKRTKEPQIVAEGNRR